MSLKKQARNGLCPLISWRSLDKFHFFSSRCCFSSLARPLFEGALTPDLTCFCYPHTPSINQDVHITSDDVIIMFHDPSLERTTDGKGFIREQAWSNVIEHYRTIREPRQQIPTFQQVCDLLMKPENMHVKLNVSMENDQSIKRVKCVSELLYNFYFLQIDIKPDNNPERLFRLMKAVVESYPNYAIDLSPRLILGLWHPVFLQAALEYVPTLRRIHIGASPTTARTYFWEHCDGFSMWFPSLVTQDGQNFIQHARNEGKDLFVWTVNRSDEMIEATRWGVKAILTDKTDLYQDLRKGMTGESLKFTLSLHTLPDNETDDLFRDKQPTMLPLAVNKLDSFSVGQLGDIIQYHNSLFKHGGSQK